MRRNRPEFVSFADHMVPANLLKNLKRAIHLFHERLLEGDSWVVGARDEIDGGGRPIKHFVVIDFLENVVHYKVNDREEITIEGTHEFLRSELEDEFVLLGIILFAQECLDV